MLDDDAYELILDEIVEGGDPVLTCDICGKHEWSGDLTPDWNGETGNHISCEKEIA